LKQVLKKPLIEMPLFVNEPPNEVGGFASWRLMIGR